MAFGQIKSAFLRSMRAGMANRGRGSEAIDRMRVRWLAFSVGVTAAADANVASSSAETDVGLDLPNPCMVLPYPFVQVLTVEATGATKTLDIGLLSSETAGDADGFLDGVSVAAAGGVKGTLLDGSITLGALLQVEAGVGADVAQAPEPHIVTASNAVSLVVTAGSADFAELSAVIYIPYMEPQGEVPTTPIVASS